MTAITVTSAKLAIVFPEGKLRRVDPADPRFEIALVLSGIRILAKINAKAARKLAAHTGGAVLQGRLLTAGWSCWTLGLAGSIPSPPRKCHRKRRLQQGHSPV